MTESPLVNDNITYYTLPTPCPDPQFQEILALWGLSKEITSLLFLMGPPPTLQKGDIIACPARPSPPPPTQAQPHMWSTVPAYTGEYTSHKKTWHLSGPWIKDRFLNSLPLFYAYVCFAWVLCLRTTYIYGVYRGSWNWSYRWLGATIWVLGMELESSMKAASDLKHWVIFIGPKMV